MPAPTFGRYSVVETSSHIPREPERTATGKSVNKLRSLHYCVACRWWKRNGREPAQCVNKWLEDSAGEDKVVRAAYQKKGIMISRWNFIAFFTTRATFCLSNILISACLQTFVLGLIGNAAKSARVPETCPRLHARPPKNNFETDHSYDFV